MLRTPVLAACLVALWTSSAQADTCESSYAICMGKCATDRMAERCMQRCQGKRNQCQVLDRAAKADTERTVRGQPQSARSR
jgi:hypothetical protein